MKRKLKVIIASIITTLMLVLTLTVTVHASEYDAIQTEVLTLVAEGKLPSYHNYLSNNKNIFILPPPRIFGFQFLQKGMG